MIEGDEGQLNSEQCHRMLVRVEGVQESTVESNDITIFAAIV